MRAAIEAAAAVRTTTSPNPWVGTVVVDDDGASSPPAPPSRRAAPTLNERPSATPARQLAGRRWSPRSSRARTPAAPRRASTPSSTPASTGSSSASRTPIRRSPGRASPRCARPASRWPSVSRPTRSRRNWRRTSPTGGPGGPTWCSSWPRRSTDGRRRPTGRASGSPARRPGPTLTACVPRATPCSSAPAPSAPTTRRSPSATWPGVIRCRVVLGRAPEGARIHPCVELSGDLGAVLDELGRRDVVQLLVEGGATVAHAFHAEGLVDRYVVYVAPAVMGGDDALGLFRGPAAPSIDCPAAGPVRGRDTAWRRPAARSGHAARHLSRGRRPRRLDPPADRARRVPLPRVPGRPGDRGVRRRDPPGARRR